MKLKELTITFHKLKTQVRNTSCFLKMTDRLAIPIREQEVNTNFRDILRSEGMRIYVLQVG